MRTNPYLNRMPVREPARFFGRRREIRRVLEGLGADPPQSFSVVGDRRIGKSSLLHQIRHPAVIATHVPAATRPSMRIRYHDFQAGVPRDEDAFIAFLCSEVAAALAAGELRDSGTAQQGSGSPPPAAGGRETLIEMLGQADSGSLRLALLWDEFEVVTRHRAIGPDLYAFLRSLAQNHRVAFVVASGKDLRTVAHSAQVADSPFFNVFQTLRLRPLSGDEAGALVCDLSDAAGLPLAAHVRFAIDHLGGCFPFFLQIACTALFEHLDEQGGVGEPDVRAVEARFLEEVEPHFRYVWEERLSADERAVMAEAAHGRVTGTASRRAADRLEREGYLIRQADVFAPFSRCFANFIREIEDEAGGDEDSARVATAIGETRADGVVRRQVPQPPPAAAPRSPGSTPPGRRGSTPGPLAAGSVLLGKYEVISKIGEGGMGKVFLATHVHLGRRVVVKVLGPQVAHAPDMVARFRREAMAASAIGHPNVVQVYDFDWHEDGRPFIVMEYLEGEDLAARIYGPDGRDRRPLPPAEAASILCAACDGLAAAHERQIVHRDLKPSNLFLARTGGTTAPGAPGYVVKILDFGISKIADAPAQQLTRASGMLGTPCYMAPEQIADASTAGPAADQYALGVVLYEALTGSLPFEAGVALSRPFWPGSPPPPPPPSHRRPGISAALDAAVLSALAFDPFSRFDGVAAFAAALRALPG